MKKKPFFVYKRKYLLYVTLTISFLLNPLFVRAQTELTDEMFSDEPQNLVLTLNNIDRFQYVISIDGHETTYVQGYERALNSSWSRATQKQSRTVILDNITPGLHSVTIEAIQDPNIRKSHGREEFLYDYYPLSFNVDVQPNFMSQHTVDLKNDMPSRVVAEHKVEYTEKEWKEFSEQIEGREIKFNLQQFRKKDKMGRAIRRLNKRGKWDKAQKYIYFANLDVSMEGKLLWKEEKLPCAGRVEFRYWEYTQGKWWYDAFLDNVIKDKTRIQPVAKTIPLVDGYEMRVAAHNTFVAYTILKTAVPTMTLSATDD